MPVIEQEPARGARQSPRTYRNTRRPRQSRRIACFWIDDPPGQKALRCPWVELLLGLGFSDAVLALTCPHEGDASIRFTLSLRVDLIVEARRCLL
jgi:hypothetical protein